MRHTVTKRDVQCVKCGDWLGEWEVHPESDLWTLCFSCGELFFHDVDILVPVQKKVRRRSHANNVQEKCSNF